MVLFFSIENRYFYIKYIIKISLILRIYSKWIRNPPEKLLEIHKTKLTFLLFCRFIININTFSNRIASKKNGIPQRPLKEKFSQLN